MDSLTRWQTERDARLTVLRDPQHRSLDDAIGAIVARYMAQEQAGKEASLNTNA